MDTRLSLEKSPIRIMGRPPPPLYTLQRGESQAVGTDEFWFVARHCGMRSMEVKPFFAKKSGAVGATLLMSFGSTGLFHRVLDLGHRVRIVLVTIRVRFTE